MMSVLTCLICVLVLISIIISYEYGYHRGAVDKHTEIFTRIDNEVMPLYKEMEKSIEESMKHIQKLQELCDQCG